MLMVLFSRLLEIMHTTRFPSRVHHKSEPNVCHFNSLSIANSGGFVTTCQGESLGVAPNSSCLNFPFMSSVFGTANRPNIDKRVGALNRCQKRCIFWAQKGLFCRPCLCPNASKQSVLAKIHFFTRSQNLEGKITIFTVLKWRKGEITMKTTIWAAIIENVVRKGRKWTHFGPKMCTVSRWERQFDKWHPFRAYTGRGGGGCGILAVLEGQLCLWQYPDPGPV